MTIRCPVRVSFHAASTSASGTGRASTRKVPLESSAAMAGSSARMSPVGTEPCPLPTICRRAARNAAEGTAAAGPAMEPTWKARAFIAIARGTRDYCQAYHHGPNRPEVLDIMVKNKIVADRELLDRMDWQARSPDGAFNLDSVDSVQTFFKQEAIINKTAPRERLVDGSFAQAAAQELGPFRLANAASELQGCR